MGCSQTLAGTAAEPHPVREQNPRVCRWEPAGGGVSVVPDADALFPGRFFSKETLPLPHRFVTALLLVLLLEGKSV